MATITTFRELDVWQMAMDLVMDCYDLTERYPTHEPALEKLSRTGQMLHGLQRSLERRLKTPVVVLLTALGWLAGSALLF
jgi:hypothetical protein